MASDPGAQAIAHLGPPAHLVLGLPSLVSLNLWEPCRAVSRSFPFRPQDHLRRPSDFRRVYDRRKSASDRWLIVYGRENGLTRLRVGFSVSRKVGSAVVRNRFRRLYREAFRLTRPRLPVGFDLILIPRSSAEPPLAELKKSLLQLVAQLASKLQRAEGPPP